MKTANYAAITRTTVNPSDKMDDKWQGIAANPAPADLVYCPNAHKEDDHILFGTGGGAGLFGGGADGKKRGHLHRRCRFCLSWSRWGQVPRNTTAALCSK
jgi:hypothetical protein